MTEKIDLKELAEEQFRELKKLSLSEDHHAAGGYNEKEYDIHGMKFKIQVDGFWESGEHFDWKVWNSFGDEISSGSEY